MSICMYVCRQYLSLSQQRERLAGSLTRLDTAGYINGWWDLPITPSILQVGQYADPEIPFTACAERSSSVAHVFV